MMPEPARPPSAASDAALAVGVAPPDAAAVLELFQPFLATALGRDSLAALRFQREPAELELQQRRWQQAALWRQRRGAFAFASLSDPRPLLRQAVSPSAGLLGRELLEVAAFAEAAAALHQSLLAPAEASGGDPQALWPLLAEMASALPDLSPFARQLRRALLPSGELADAASPELARLRQLCARQRSNIEQELGRQMQRLEHASALQEALVTVRNDRFVLPVRADARRQAPGVVHGASSSGQTVFVEPLETIELNNEFLRLQEAERAEQRRILRALAAAVAAAAPEFEAAAALAGALELEAAKASFAAQYRAAPAAFVAELDLMQARHPLLVASFAAQPGRAVVPLTLRLAPQRLLVVSGPNTGGKTLALKTVAVACWMAQCGLPVCAQSARLPILDALWADIGDEQSIQHDLSTFSSHLLHVRDILAAATPASLVLLDELGTATNAAEGAALAIEIAAWLRRLGCWTLISTHHDSLKAWAGEQPGMVANGSVAVDPVTLAPNYQFRMGVPGLSAGLDMAARLGLPPQIIAQARSRLTHEQREAAGYLQRLQHALAAADDRLQKLQQRQTEADQREGTLAVRERALANHDRTWQQKQMAALRAEMERRFTAFAAAGDRRWQQELDAVKTSLSAAQQRKLASLRTRQRREAATAWQAETATALGDAAPPSEGREESLAQPGDQVRLRSLHAPARVLRRLPGGGYEVSAGAVRMQVAAADIAGIISAAKPASTAPSAPTPERLTPATLEVNLIGLRAEEASDRLDKFLDDALLAGVEQVRIVHGSGFGILRQVVAEALRAHPKVARFAHPPQNQGGHGVTLADLE